MGTSFALALTLLAQQAPLTADSVADIDRSIAPHFVLEPVGDKTAADLLWLSESRAEVVITGSVAEVRVFQTWVNDSDQTLAADYVFPSSTRAAVHDMVMTIGERTIRADIKKKADAQKIYNQAIAQGRTASLLEQQRPNVFRTRVGNIQPDDIIELEFEYSELLVPEEGITRFVYPRVVGARFGGEFNGLRAGVDHQNPYSIEPNQARDWSVDVLLKGALPVSNLRSPTHLIKPSFRSAKEAWVRLTSDGLGPADATDLVLEYRHADNAIAQGALLYRDKEHGENYFMMTLAPPPALKNTEIAPRELVFVVDVSGSMGGFPTTVVQQTMSHMLATLTKRDRFNLLLFAGTQATFRERSVRATARNISDALEFLDHRGSGGGTLLQQALDKAYALPKHNPGVARSFVLLSDGFIHADREVIHNIWTRRKDSTVFAVGIGQAPNRFLMEGLARASGTQAFFVQNPEEIDRTVQRFARYASRPALTDINITFDGFDAYDLAPQHVGDLLADRPIVVMGKYRGPASGRILVDAKSGGRAYRGMVKIEDNLEDKAHRALRVLWARERVRELVDFLPLTKRSEEEVTALGLEHRLLTRFTSFVAVDSEVRKRANGPDKLGSKKGAPEMDKDKREEDRKTAAEALKQLGLKANGKGSNVFGAGGLGTGANNALGGLAGAAMGDAGGAGGLGVRGLGAGGGGSAQGSGVAPLFAKKRSGSVGLGSVGTKGYGRGSGGYGGAGGRGGIVLGGRGKGMTRVRAGKVTYKGSLSREEIQRVLRRVQNQVKHCYEKELAKDATLQGKVVVSFSIQPTGLVANARVAQNTMGEKKVAACVLRVLKRVRYPKPRGAGTVHVTYPYIFGASGNAKAPPPKK